MRWLAIRLQVILGLMFLFSAASKLTVAGLRWRAAGLGDLLNTPAGDSTSRRLAAS